MKAAIVSKFISTIFIASMFLTRLDGQIYPCGNNTSGSKSSPPIAPFNSADPFDAYTGNDFREVNDLAVWGGVGEHQLNFTRYGFSRFNDGATYFGLGHNWRHSYQWLMTNNGTNSSGQAQLLVYYPDGTHNNFVNTSPNQWFASVAVTDIIYQSGTTYTLQRKNGWRYNFVLVRTGVYHMQNFTDSMGSVYACTYDGSDNLLRVTEPGGRYIQITYTTINTNYNTFNNFASVTVKPSDGVWVTISVTATASYRFLRYYGPDRGYCDISEVQFYNKSGALLSGTPIGGGPAASPGTDYTKATDGDTTTYFDSSAQSGSYTGIDLGAGVTSQIGSVRFLCRPGYGSRMYNSSANGVFQGGNIRPISQTVIASVSTSDGRSVAYNYSTFTDPSVPFSYPLLSNATYGDGTQATYTYSQVFPTTAPLLATASDPRYTMKGANVKVQNTYETADTTALGFLQTQSDPDTGIFLAGLGSAASQADACPILYPGGRKTQPIAIHATGQGSGLTDALGKTETYTYALNSGTAGFEVSRTDRRGNVEQRVPSTYNNPLGRTHPDGSTESWARDSRDLPLSHTDELGQTTTYTRDSQHRLTQISYPDATSEAFTYNSLNKVLTHSPRNGGTENFTYDTSGKLLTKTDAAGQVWNYTYDSSDRPASVTNPNSQTVNFLYNERGLVPQVTHPDGTTIAFTYDQFGDVLTSTNEIGKTTTYTYNNSRQKTSMTDPLGRTTTYIYNTPYTKQPDQTILPSGKIIARTFDGNFHKLTETVGYGTADAATTHYTYDANSNVLTTTDPRGKVWSYTYDSRNRKLSQTDPLGHMTQYAYDAANNVVRLTRPDGGMTTNAYDTMHRLTQTTDPKGETTTYTYDASGNMLTTTDARGNTYSYTYDLLNRRTSMTYPDGSAERYGYDGVGNMVSYTTRAGQVKTSVFDNRNREISYSWSDGTPGVTRTYDAAGRLLSSTNGVSTSTYAYDDANELLSETQTNANIGAAWTVAYSYDADGNRISTTYPSGTAVTYGYTNRNQISAIAVGGTGLAGYAYDANGNVVSKTLADGTLASYTYDNANRLITLNHALSGTSFARFDYGYDAVNRRTYEKRDSTAGDVYGYDAVDQVASVNYDATNPSSGSTGADRTVTYAYDASGNRTAVNDSVNGNASYSANSVNEYTNVGGISYASDADGNLITGNGLYLYDAQNRLTTAQVGANTDQFSYDSKNRVVEREINGTATYFIYDGWDLIEERDGSNNVLATYVHGIRHDELLTRTSGSTTIYYHHNALGSVTDLTDATGTVVENYKYDAFGKPAITDGSGNPLTATAYGNRFLFTGREYLAEVGLYDYRNRVYSADLGRFLQTDPLRFSAGDVNIYRYCGNNCLNASDPTGMCWNQMLQDFNNSVSNLNSLLGDTTLNQSPGTVPMADATLYMGFQLSGIGGLGGTFGAGAYISTDGNMGGYYQTGLAMGADIAAQGILGVTATDSNGFMGPFNNINGSVEAGSGSLTINPDNNAVLGGSISIGPSIGPGSFSQTSTAPLGPQISLFGH